ncbi:hypothetical protein ACQCLI_13745 [Pseudomonas nitroreducens]|uniref:hypothetical protein n=1 Tax=Pseudomonas nitroreducens TaxID=46680 RepID=UPI001F4325C5|nr:hypothetical protein [Pseudomonas nitroreducens]
MAWNRQPPEVVAEPAPLSMPRWLGAALLAAVVGMGLFVLVASGRIPELAGFNIWMLAGTPLLIWLLAFAVRSYTYGGALSHFQFLEDQAGEARSAWNQWAQRHFAVQSACVLMPNQVSAAVIAQGNSGISPCFDVALRITALPLRANERALAGLEMLMEGLAPGVASLPVDRALQVTVLSDLDADGLEAFRVAWGKAWLKAVPGRSQVKPTFVSELSLQWLEDNLKAPGSAIELILVLQVNGAKAYSDGLAALLLCPDALAQEWDLPVQGRLLRPMPLDVEQLDTEIPLFLETQLAARNAIGILADSAQWRPSLGSLLSMGSAQQVKFQVGQQWIQESLCGVPGPFSAWLLAALGLEMSRHFQQPLVLLSQEPAQRWISTVATGELA